MIRTVLASSLGNPFAYLTFQRSCMIILCVRFMSLAFIIVIVSAWNRSTVTTSDNVYYDSLFPLVELYIMLIFDWWRVFTDSINSARSISLFEIHYGIYFVLKFERLSRQKGHSEDTWDKRTLSLCSLLCRPQEPLIPTWLYKMVASLEAAILNCQCDQMPNRKGGCETIYGDVNDGEL